MGPLAKRLSHVVGYQKNCGGLLPRNSVSGTFIIESYYYQMFLLGKEFSVVEEGAGSQPNLVNLNDTDLHLEEPWQDLRGLDVYDTNDDQIGSVEDVYVDREQRQARLLDVSVGGVLGVGKKHFLVPVEDVKRDVNEERITVEHPKDKVMESPEFDPDNGPKLDLQRAVYAYYGHLFQA
jgi:sporulation protein YlmC with PRC-barrel domain